MADDRQGDLRSLGQRLDKARDVRDQAERRGPGGSRAPLGGGGFALRASIEMVACLGTGAGLGWWLDRVLGTGPWLLAVFVLLGGAAGVWTVMRLSGRLMTEAEQHRIDRGNGNG